MICPSAAVVLVNTIFPVVLPALSPPLAVNSVLDALDLASN